MVKASDMKPRGVREGVGIDVAIRVFLFFWGALMVVPLWYVFVSSVSYGTAVDSGEAFFWPVGFNLDSFQNVLSKSQFWISIGNTFFYTIVGTAYSMLISTTAAYALSRPAFRGRKVINFALSFTMWFHAGFIPLYLNFKNLGVINDRWGIIVSFGVTAFYIILLRNYFESVPKELEEAARIDGANEFRIFSDVYLPLSKVALITIIIFYAIGRWNGFFWSMVLLKQSDLIPLQVYIQQMIVEEQLVLENASSVGAFNYNFTTLKYALIVCSIIPVAVAYPFVQRYFAKGVLTGGVKE